MTAEESDRTGQIRPEQFAEAIRAGHLVEAIRAGYESAAHSVESFPSSVERAFVEEAYHPEVEWHLRTDLPDSRTLHGREEVLGLWTEWGDSFDDFLTDPLEIFETGGKVVAVLRLSGRIKGSDQQVAMDEVHVFSFRDGMVSEVREYLTKGEALKALGLPESMTFANRFAKPL